MEEERETKVGWVVQVGLSCLWFCCNSSPRGWVMVGGVEVRRVLEKSGSQLVLFERHK